MHAIDISHIIGPYTRYTAVVSAATTAGKGQSMTLQFYSLEGGKMNNFTLYYTQ